MWLRSNGEHAGAIQYFLLYGESPEWSSMVRGSEPLVPWLSRCNKGRILLCPPLAGTTFIVQGHRKG